MEAFGVEQEISSTIGRRVDLPSGGYLIFDYAEAFTVIDVNTGRFVGGRGKNVRRQARGHDHEEQPRGGEGSRPPAATARHRRDHRHRLHRHGEPEEPRHRRGGAAHGARARPDEDVRRRDLAARPRRDDPPERDRRPARGDDPQVPDVRRRRDRLLRGVRCDRRRAALRALSAGSRAQAFRVELADPIASALVGPGAPRLIGLEALGEEAVLPPGKPRRISSTSSSSPRASLPSGAADRGGGGRGARCSSSVRSTATTGCGRGGSTGWRSSSPRLRARREGVKVRVERVLDGRAYAVLTEERRRRRAADCRSRGREAHPQAAGAEGRGREEAEPARGAERRGRGAGRRARGGGRDDEAEGEDRRGRGGRAAEAPPPRRGRGGLARRPQAEEDGCDRAKRRSAGEAPRRTRPRRRRGHDPPSRRRSRRDGKPKPVERAPPSPRPGDARSHRGREPRPRREASDEPGRRAGDGAEAPQPKKKTRRGSRGGRTGRRSRPPRTRTAPSRLPSRGRSRAEPRAGTDARQNGEWEYVPMSEWADEIESNR